MLFLLLIYFSFISLGLPDSLLGSSWPFMHLEFGVDIGNAGPVSMTISFGTIISALLSHRLIDRFGTGKITFVSVTMTAVALLGFSLSPSFPWLILFAVPLGLGAGAVDSGLNGYVAAHYEAKHMSWLHCFWGIGAMLGPLVVSLLARANFGWRSGYLSMSLVQFGLVALLFFSLPLWKTTNRDNTSEYDMSNTDHSSWKSLFTPLRTKGVIFAIITFFLYCSVENSMMLWGASYLVSKVGLGPENAAAWVSFFFLGLTLGRGASGFITMRFSNETLIKMGVGTVFVGFVVMLLPLPSFVTLLAFTTIGFGLAPIFPCMLHQTPVYFGKEKAQAIMGLQMACAYLGITIMPPLFGQLFSRLSFGLMPWVLILCTVGMFLSTRRLSGLGTGSGKGQTNTSLQSV